jgi:uncharacterized membrane protein YccC
VGAVLALATYATWPTWAGQSLPSSLATLIDAYRGYARCVLAGYLGSAPSPEALADARRAARLARTNALAALSRARVEPLRSHRPTERSQALLASSHRFVRSMIALEATLDHAGHLEYPAQLGKLAEDIEVSLGTLSDVLRGRAAPGWRHCLPDIRHDERRLAQALAASSNGTNQPRAVLAIEADRIANSLGTMIEVLADEAGD